MKNLVILIISIILFSAQAFAVDGEVYFGAYLDGNLRGDPEGTNNAKYMSGINVGGEVKTIRLDCSIDILMNDFSSEYHSFHPSSARFTVGISKYIKNIGLSYQHMCWHPIDRGELIEQYDLLKVGIKFGKD